MNSEKQSEEFSKKFTENSIRDRKRQLELVSSRSTDQLQQPSMTEREISEAKTLEIQEIQNLQKQFQESSTESAKTIELTPEQENYKEAYLELQRVISALGKAENTYMLNQLQESDSLSQEDKDFLTRRQTALVEKIAELKEQKIALNLKVYQLEVACQNKNQSTEEALSHKTAKEKEIEHGYAVQNLEHRILTQQEHLDAIRSQRALPKEERKMFTQLQSDSELENEELLFEQLVAKSKRALRALQESASPTLKKERLQKEMYLASQALDKHKIKIRKDNTLSYWDKRKIKNNPEARIAWATYEELEEKIAALPTQFEDTSVPKQSNANLGDRKDFHGDETTTEILDEYFSAKNKQDQEIEANRTLPNIETQLSQLKAKRDALYNQLNEYEVQLKSNNTLSYWNRRKVRKNPVVKELWQSYNTLDTQIERLTSQDFDIPQTIEAPAVTNSLNTTPETIESIHIPSEIPQTIEAPAVQDSEEYIPSNSNTNTGKPPLRYPEHASPENKLLQFRHELIATFPKELQRVTEVAEALRTAYIEAEDITPAEHELSLLAEAGLQQIKQLLEESKGTPDEKATTSYLTGIRSLLLSYSSRKKIKRQGTTDPSIEADIRKGLIERLEDSKNLIANVGNFESIMATLKVNRKDKTKKESLIESSISTQDEPLPKLELVSSQDTNEQESISSTEVLRRVVELEEAIQHQQRQIRTFKHNTDIDSFLNRGIITKQKHQEIQTERSTSLRKLKTELKNNIEELLQLQKRETKLRAVTPIHQNMFSAETIVPTEDRNERNTEMRERKTLLHKTRMSYIKMRVAENRQYLITQRHTELQRESKKINKKIQDVQHLIKNTQPKKLQSFFMSSKRKNEIVQSAAELEKLHSQLLWDKNEIDIQLKSDEEFTVELPQVELDLQLYKADLERYIEEGALENVISERLRLIQNRKEYGYAAGDDSEDIPLLDEMIDYIEELDFEYENAA